MIRNTRTPRALIAALSLLACGLLSARADAAPCADVFEQLYPASATPTVRKTKNAADGVISYGLEGEVPLNKAKGLLDWYRPRDKTDAEWLGMSLDQRASVAGKSGYNFVKTADAPEWLLEKLSSDPGGAELISKPTDKLETALAWIKTIEDKAGKSASGRSHIYWQGNVAYIRGGDFSKKHLEGIEGYVRAAGDYAQFRKLEKGYAFHKQNPDYIPGKNLGHGVLGPLNTSKMADMGKEMLAAKEGRKNNSHGHYIQGTYFRTWAYGENRNGFEVRDPHKDVALLKQEMRRLTHGLQKGFKGYEKFKKLSALDETAHFNKFSDGVKTMLRSVANSYKGRYALPMKPFEVDYPAALGLSGDKKTQFSQRITSARQEYVRTLETIATASGDNKAKLNQVRVALAKFAFDTKIASTLDSQFAKLAR
jgi:hypothetical protein